MKSSLPADSPPPSPKRIRRNTPTEMAQLRKELLDVTLGLFMEGGVDAVSMRAVAARVGVSPMTTYRYFVDKADLLSGLWQFVLAAVYADMRDKTALASTARQKQRASIDAFIAYWEAHPDHYRLVYMTEYNTTTRTLDSQLVVSPVVDEMLEFSTALTTELAKEIGASLDHIKLAIDLRYAMQLGYLQATLINRRYSWSPPSVLRDTYINTITEAVEHCLLHGPAIPTQSD